MKSIQLISLLLLALLITSCSSDDDSPSRSTESITITIDNDLPMSFSENIDAVMVPLPPQSGFSNYFTIDSENTSGDAFHFNLPPTTEDTYSVPMNTTIDFPIPLSQFCTYQGSLIDDANPGNAVYLQLTQFDNVGGQVKAQITGVYYDAGNVMHNISISIDVTRDL